MKFKLEAIGFTIDSCLAAQVAGADRIELCDNPADGGTTPSYGFIKAASQLLHIDLFPIVRPRGGDFLYSTAEFEVMKSDVEICKDLGCEGVVFGILNADGTVDKKRCSILAEIAYPLSITFHRAFDRTADPFKAMEDIIEIGCERILTSGQKATALEGSDMISKLIEQADERIVIMPGSGIRSDNITEIAQRTKAVEFHTSARMMTGSKMKFMSSTLKENSESVFLDEQEIKNIISALKNI